MNKTKRSIAIFLALTSLLTLFSFPASAVEPTGMTISQLAAASGEVASSLVSVIQTGTLGENGIYYNITAPSFITVGAYEMGIEDYVVMAARAINQIRAGGAATTNIPYLDRTLGTKTCTEAGTTTSLTKEQYLELAERVSKLGTTSATMPTSFNRPTDGINYYNGRICIFSIAQLFAKVLQGYASSGTLVATAEFLSTNYTTSQTYTPERNWYNEVMNAAVTVADYVEKNKKLPTSVTVNGTSVTMSQFAVLELQVVVGLSQGKTNDALSIPTVTACENPSETLTGGQITKANYLTYATNILNFVNNNGNLIPNYVTTSLGTMRYENFTYTYASILRSYRQNGSTLPASVTVKPWDEVIGTYDPSTGTYSWLETPSSISAPNGTTYSRSNLIKATSNCQVTNSTIISVAKTGIKNGGTPTNMNTAAKHLEAYLNAKTDYGDYYGNSYYNTVYGAVTTWTHKNASGHGYGNCCDMGHLGNACARAVGIPAGYAHATCRFSSGLVTGHVFSWWWCGSAYGWKRVDMTSSRNSLGVQNNCTVSTWNTKFTTTLGF